MAARERIDRLLVARGLAPSRTRAQALVVAGQVVVDDQRVDKPGTLVSVEADVRLRGEDHPYASRGGVKLAGALARFGVALDVRGRVAMDVGASTGGFTDCLLQRGVLRVHAVDVGRGQLAWKLATDARVIVHDRANIRTLDPTVVGEQVDLVVVDCSFIAAAKIIPELPRFLATRADAVVLVKPQFELDRGRVGKGGIVTDEVDRAEALERARAAAVAAGFAVEGACDSELPGATGNRELFLWLSWAR